MKPANPSPHVAAEEEKEAVKLEKPNEHDVEYTMDSEPDLADEPDDDELDIPNADEDPEKLAEPGAFRMLPQLAPSVTIVTLVALVTHLVWKRKTTLS